MYKSLYTEPAYSESALRVWGEGKKREGEERKEKKKQVGTLSSRESTHLLKRSILCRLNDLNMEVELVLQGSRCQALHINFTTLEINPSLD